MLLAGMLLISSAAVFTGCRQNTGMKGDAYVLNIYRARDSGMVDGTRDEQVRQAIEEKFAKDTGINISLQVNVQNNEDLPDKINVLFGVEEIDAICHYMSEDAGSIVTKYAKEPDSTIDLDPLLAEYGQDYLKQLQTNDPGHLSDRAGYYPITSNNNVTYKRTALSSITNEKGFGVIIRKDLMRAVMAQTGLNPEDYDILNDNYKSMTVSQFEKLMIAIKNDPNNSVGDRPIMGQPWDLGRVVAPALGVNGMADITKDADGKFVPNQFGENYGKLINLMYRWANSDLKLWENDAQTTTDSTRQSRIIAGIAAAYCAYPTAEECIKLNQRFKAANSASHPEWELMMIAPFASEDENGDPIVNADGKQQVNGNVKIARSFYGVTVPYNSINSDKLVMFINWMWSNKENYDLCKYGVKGVDWVEGTWTDDQGNTYDTWQYPANKKTEYATKPPYSGKYLILENVKVSNRINGAYSEDEKKWYTRAYNDFPVYGDTETEGIWLPEIPRNYASDESDITGSFVQQVRSPAWAGVKGEGGVTPDESLINYVATMRSKYGSYLDYIDAQYNRGIEYFKNKYNN